MAVLALPTCFARAETPVPPTAPEPPPPDLRVLKAGFRKQVLTVAIPEMKTHAEALLALEKRLAAAQDFAGAAKARDERSKVEKQIAALEQEASILESRPSVEQSLRVGAQIELKLSDAKLTAVRLDESDGAITGWDQPNAAATWQLPNLPPGGYEVVIRCTGQAGSVVIKEEFYSLTAMCKAVEDKALDQKLGVLRIMSGAGTLTLSVAQPEKCATWRVYSLVLVPPSL